MKRWRATVTFTTAAGGLREWTAKIEAADAETASEKAMREFKLSRPALRMPRVVGFDLDPVD